MELNEIPNFKEAFQNFGGIPMNSCVESVHVGTLTEFIDVAEAENSRVFLLPYYGLSILQDVTDCFELNDLLIDSRFATPEIVALLETEGFDTDAHYRGTVKYIEELVKVSRTHFDKVCMHHYDDFLIYSEDENGYWEFWFHKSGDGSCTRVEKYIPFDQWVQERTQSYIGVSHKDVPNAVYEIHGTRLLDKFKW